MVFFCANNSKIADFDPCHCCSKQAMHYLYFYYYTLQDIRLLENFFQIKSISKKLIDRILLYLVFNIILWLIKLVTHFCQTFTLWEFFLLLIHSVCNYTYILADVIISIVRRIVNILTISAFHRSVWKCVLLSGNYLFLYLIKERKIERRSS